MEAQRARPVVALLIATIVLGLVLLVAFDPDIQTIDADELVQRKDDARAFLVGDYVFIVLYAVLSPVAIWRFRAALREAPVWMALAAVLLVAAGLVDATENTLLITSTDSVSSSAVETAHDLAVPKTTLFTLGALLAIATNVRAVRILRAP